MSHDESLDAMARRVIDANHYMTLATVDPDGRPRVSPVYYTPARYTDVYWVSSPEAQHSRNIADRPDIEIVIFDSSLPVGEGEAVYLTAYARAIDDHELEQLIPEAFRTTAGARAFARVELQGRAALRLYIAHATQCEVHVAGRHPLNPTGIDVRMPAHPA
jgi:nitroimidazol reductase NimA-like FMN-containing flavoprotein (pyridoxamine 5'-phosphate oxidase superfamily)